MYSKSSNYEIYNKVSEITGLNFKTQIKDCGIYLKDLHLIKDVVSNKSHFLLGFDKGEIKFVTKEDFIVEFHNYVLKSLNGLKEEFKQLNENEMDYMMFGPNEIYYKHEELGVHTQKHERLLEKFRKFHKEL
ncbi:hypothetical protein SAMN04489761_3462 [Tenacibaculum sp. MAR_2009_124]|uniref:hypothetical protein n=1 Tax=Tenacibaculum sp. MAR_2009_124 TaxID=1250059 RepID=UPI00089C9F77|nr:hypothetical protein [Tenacibaculum sp. MAR_2009_124]SEC67198.1 hypothetical protein SAMN04489761_3462 [Tenacibaculum sp. MAR_2009_124]